MLQLMTCISPFYRVLSSFLFPVVCSFLVMQACFAALSSKGQALAEFAQPSSPIVFKENQDGSE